MIFRCIYKPKTGEQNELRYAGASGTPPTQVFRNFRRGDPCGRPPNRTPEKPLPPLPKGRGTSRRLVEGFVRGNGLRIFCEFVRAAGHMGPALQGEFL